jgi:hypothetical protein
MSDRMDWIKEKFADFLPEGMAAAVRGDLRGAEQLLDGAQMQRKEFEEKKPEDEQAEEKPADPPPPPPPPPPPAETAAETAPEAGDVAAQVADQLTASVTAAIAGDFSQLTEEKLRALLIAEMSPPAEEPAVEAPPPSNEPGEAQTVEDKGVKPSPSPVVPLTDEEQVTALFKSLLQQTEDQGALVRTLTAQAERIAELDAAVKALGPTVQQVIELKAQLERLTAQRPRASESDETLLGDDEASKALGEAIEKGLQGPDQKFLGVPVKSMPT